MCLTYGCISIGFTKLCTWVSCTHVSALGVLQYTVKKVLNIEELTHIEPFNLACFLNCVFATLLVF